MNSHFVRLEEVLKQAIEAIDQYSHQVDKSLMSGFTEWDAMTHGLDKGLLTVIAGRTGMGTTTLATNIAENAAINQGKGVAFFSTQLSALRLTLRLLSSQTRIEHRRLYQGLLTEEEWLQLTDSLSILNNVHLCIAESTALSLQTLTQQICQLLAKQPVDLIIIDNLQGMTSGQQKGAKSTLFTVLSRGLKQLARELDLHMIVLSDIPADVEYRPNKRPCLMDLHETGRLESDADTVVFIYRDEVYCNDSLDNGMAEILVEKNRYGHRGSFKLRFKGSYNRFENPCSD